MRSSASPARSARSARCQRSGGFDAVYLDLHGAAVAEHLDDGEGELLARIRTVVGPDVPIVASLDLHANVTQQMLETADALVAYRTYPHVDMADTGRAGRALAGRGACSAAAREPLHAHAPAVPDSAECADHHGRARRSRSTTSCARWKPSTTCVLSFAIGFPAADFAECGPVVWAHGERGRGGGAQSCMRASTQPRRSGGLTARAACRRGARRSSIAARRAPGPVVIADTQDNPGAGGDSNTTGMLHALLAEGAGRRFPQQVALGLMWDPEAAAAAHAAGVGAKSHSPWAPPCRPSPAPPATRRCRVALPCAP